LATKRKYRSQVAKAVHEGVRSMYRLGLVDKKTMREFDMRGERRKGRPLSTATAAK
jgi:DNA-binding transcriptional regulator YiaG